MRLVWTAGLLVTLALSGCDLFRPAEPEPPAAGTGFVPDYSQPDSSLATIARALADKGLTIGSVAYAGAFAESVTAGAVAGFHHLFWPEDAASFSQAGGTVPSDWGFSLEQTFYSRFVRLRPDAYRMAWMVDPPNPDDIGADVATIHRHYLVTSHSSDGTQTSVLAIGYADLRLLRFSDGAWRIVRWDDRRDPGADPSDPEQITLGRRRLNTTR